MSLGSETDSSIKHPDCVKPGSESFLGGKKVHTKKVPNLINYRITDIFLNVWVSIADYLEI